MTVRTPPVARPSRLAARARRVLRRAGARRDERGAGGVEFLIVASVLIGLFTILVQYGINLHASRIAQAAAREGATAAARWDGTNGAGTSAARQYLNDGSPAVRSSTVHVSRGAEQATVTVTVRPAVITPWLADPITSRATAPVERWVE